MAAGFAVGLASLLAPMGGTGSAAAGGTAARLEAALAVGSGKAMPLVTSSVPTVTRPCGTARGRPKVDEVLLIWEENHSYGSVIGSPEAHEINRLAQRCGLATHYEAVTHPSLPNYMAMTSGLPFAYPPWDGDCEPQGNCTTRAASVFGELAAAGKQWRSYAESMPANCSRTTKGTYAARHNPAVYYTSIRSQCLAWDQPLGTTRQGALHEALAHGPAAALSTVTPDVDDDMHDGTVGQADSWLAGWLPEILASPSYRSGRLAVVIAWDEGFGSGNVPSSAPLVIMSAYTHPGTRASLALNDYSVLRSICELAGLRQLGLASRATSFVGAFNL